LCGPGRGLYYALGSGPGSSQDLRVRAGLSHAQAAQQRQPLPQVANEAGPLLRPERVGVERGAIARLHEELQLQGASPALSHRHFSIWAARAARAASVCVCAHIELRFDSRRRAQKPSGILLASTAHRYTTHRASQTVGSDSSSQPDAPPALRSYTILLR
jgi:hypothetical protein